jgi:ferric enterobactin receptor
VPTRSPYASAQIFSLFAEDNMELTDSTMLTPGLRLRSCTPIAGNNWSPSLNLSQELGDDFTLKMGIARAYKAPKSLPDQPELCAVQQRSGLRGQRWQKWLLPAG